MKLGFAEDILLLALDDKTGRFHPLPDKALGYAVAAALLLELAFDNRIDTDPGHLYVLERKKSDDAIHTKVLDCLGEDEEMTIIKALSRVVIEVRELKCALLNQLEKKGVLQK